MNTGIHNFRYRLTVISLILGLIGLSACASTPSTTRSGEVHDVKIQEGLEPSTLSVKVGDEVRWVNHRSDDIRIDFLGDALDDVSCRRGFSNLVGMTKESATVGANKTASLCFEKATVVKYNVRMDTALPGGKQIVQGEVKVRK